MIDSAKSERDTWSVADLIDFEVLVAEDESISAEDQAKLKARDRAIYRSVKETDPASHDKGRSWWFRKWLDERRKDRFRSEFTPGEEVSSLFTVVKIFFLISGLFTARALVWSFFHGAQINTEHPEPINVVAYWLLCIGFTLGLSLCGFWVLLFNETKSKLLAPPTPGRSILLRMLTPLFNQIAKRISNGLPVERRLTSKALSGALKQHLSRRRDAISAMVFCHLQVFGLAFACGVLLCSAFDLSLADRVFGWQTTLFRNTEPSVFHECLRVISSPWNFLTSERWGLPSLEQIKVTQYSSSRDVSGFPPDAAKAWAEFLVLSAVAYGVVPRAILYLLSKRKFKRAMRDLNFEDYRSDRLWERFMTPSLTVGKESEPPFIVDPKPVSSDDFSYSELKCTVLLRPGLDQSALGEAISSSLKAMLYEADPILRLPSSIGDASKLIATLPKRCVYIVHPSWIWNNGEVQDLLQEIRQSVGPKVTIMLGLIGKPNGEPLGSAPSKSDLDVWRKLIMSAGDPHMAVTTFNQR